VDVTIQRGEQKVTKHTGELRGAQGCGKLCCERSAEMREGAGANCGECENTRESRDDCAGRCAIARRESRSARLI